MKGPGLWGLTLLLLVGSAVALPAGAPRDQGASPPRSDDEAAATSLLVVFHGPSEGRDAADPYEDVAGAATGSYFTQAVSDGYARLTGRLSFYPSVCAECVLETPHATSREVGLVAVEYSYASPDGGALSVRLAGEVDWEVAFEHDVAGLAFATNDPYGPPVAEQVAHFRHEASASIENDFDPERSFNAFAPVTVTYEAVPLGVPEGEAPRPALEVRVVERRSETGWVRLTYAAPAERPASAAAGESFLSSSA